MSTETLPTTPYMPYVSFEHLPPRSAPTGVYGFRSDGTRLMLGAYTVHEEMSEGVDVTGEYDHPARSDAPFLSQLGNKALTGAAAEIEYDVTAVLAGFGLSAMPPAVPAQDVLSREQYALAA